MSPTIIGHNFIAKTSVATCPILTARSNHKNRDGPATNERRVQTGFGPRKSESTAAGK
jgi:hypothetical protein